MLKKIQKKAATPAAAVTQQRNIQTYIAMLKRQGRKRARRSNATLFSCSAAFRCANACFTKRLTCEIRLGKLISRESEK